MVKLNDYIIFGGIRILGPCPAPVQLVYKAGGELFLHEKNDVTGIYEFVNHTESLTSHISEKPQSFTAAKEVFINLTSTDVTKKIYGFAFDEHNFIVGNDYDFLKLMHGREVSESNKNILNQIKQEYFQNLKKD